MLHRLFAIKDAVTRLANSAQLNHGRQFPILHIRKVAVHTWKNLASWRFRGAHPVSIGVERQSTGIPVHGWFKFRVWQLGSNTNTGLCQRWGAQGPNPSLLSEKPQYFWRRRLTHDWRWWKAWGLKKHEGVTRRTKLELVDEWACKCVRLGYTYGHAINREKGSLQWKKI